MDLDQLDARAGTQPDVLRCAEERVELEEVLAEQVDHAMGDRTTLWMSSRF